MFFILSSALIFSPRIVQTCAGYFTLRAPRQTRILIAGPTLGAGDARGTITVMAVREIRVIGDPVLRTACDEITEVDDRVRQLVSDLLDKDATAWKRNDTGLICEHFLRALTMSLATCKNPKSVNSHKKFKTATRVDSQYPACGFPPNAPGTRSWWEPILTARRSYSRTPGS